MKYLPPELKEWYFPFNWNVETLWDLEGRLETREVASLEWHLDQPLWSSETGKGMLFDLKPRSVINNSPHYPYHHQRITQADLSYPICITTYLDREIIIDGIHRLAKTVEQKIKTVNIKIIDECLIQQIAQYT